MPRRQRRAPDGEVMSGRGGQEGGRADGEEWGMARHGTVCSDAHCGTAALGSSKTTPRQLLCAAGFNSKKPLYPKKPKCWELLPDTARATAAAADKGLVQK